MKLLFLLTFSLHNLEEGLWLPEWSLHAGKYHKPVERKEFQFALIVITTLGYLLTFLCILYGRTIPAFTYIYSGFIGMMILNSIFPHLVATIALKKYSPGLLTGVILIIPIGVYILISLLKVGFKLELIGLSTVVVGALVLSSLRLLFKIGRKLID
jgi:hypothetical protein